jgi:surface polysaccharide O-acyltransferase-like enzyme
MQRMTTPFAETAMRVNARLDLSSNYKKYVGQIIEEKYPHTAWSSLILGFSLAWLIKVIVGIYAVLPLIRICAKG